MLPRSCACISGLPKSVCAHQTKPHDNVGCRALIAGKIFGNAFTEIGTKEKAGSFAMQTRLEPMDAGYRLNGTKYFCTGSLFSDWVLVAASTTGGQNH